MSDEKKCLNEACEWHAGGRCSLFPGGLGFFECKHREEKTEKTLKQKKKTEKAKARK